MAGSPAARYPGYDDVLEAVWRTRDWWRTVNLTESLLVYAAGLLGGVFLATFLEAHLHFPAPVRIFILAMFLGYFAVGLVVFVFRPLFRDWSPEEVAVHVERKFPELDNELINAVQLGVDEQVQSPGMVAAVIARAASRLEALPLKKAVDTRRALYLVAVAAACLLVLGSWMGFGYERFSNALQRLVFPTRDIPALGRVRILEVQPGDARINKGSDLVVIVKTAGDPGEDADARLFYQYEGDKRALDKGLSLVSANLFRCAIENVRTPLRYRVEVAGTESRTYGVAVVEPPRLVKRGIAYDFPSYTEAAGWKDRFDEETNGDIRAPIGTIATLKFTTNKPLASALIHLGSGQQMPMKVLGEGRLVQATLTIVRDGVYSVHLKDRDGLTNPDARQNKIVALPDRPPLVEFRSPGKDARCQLGQPFKVAIAAKDDYGVSQLSLVARKGQDGAQKVIKTWRDFASPREVLLPFEWDVGAAFDCQVGDEVFYYAIALDNHAERTGGRETPKPQETKTAEFKITIEDKQKLAEEKAEAVSNWETELRKVLELQLAARSRVAALEGKDDTDILHQEATAIHKAQTDIFSRTAAVAKGMHPDDEQTQAVKESIELLAYGEMTRCAKLVGGIPRIPDLPKIREAYGAVAGSQDKIIKILRQLLNILPDLAEETEKDALDEEDVEDFPDEEEEAMKDLLRGLKEMVRQQRKVVETTDQLAKIPMEDYTPEDEKKLEDLKAIEEKWSQFLKAKISDLSKMQEQDFANTTLLKELIEIHSEVEMAKDALEAKATEIATALEDNGLMLAEKLTKQLEKWLPDTPDRDRWQMEEPLTDGYETPMAELPKELEDIVGDLMEEEEDLQQEVEDATSAWADSMDAAGWDAMDGPISNFAANGVTGNRLPNTSELSGRSAEGRQGKSVGEFVEDQFDGKGGRRTPTRLTSEAFQKGQIKDTSSTPPGGATGGGKAGGSSGEGLEGPTPPDIKVKLQNLAMRQAQIRNKAEKIALKFEVLDYPPVFEPVVKDMRVLEAALNSGRYMEARRVHNVLLRNLKGTRMFVEGKLSVESVRTPTLPPHLQAEIIDTAGAAVPDEFREYIKGYYEAISKPQ